VGIWVVHNKHIGVIHGEHMEEKKCDVHMGGRWFVMEMWKRMRNGRMVVCRT